MKTSQLAPSMMCVDFAEMTDVLRCFEAQGIEYLHVDIMDGEFVSNFTLGTDFCKYLRSHTSIPLDLHLMINRPDNKLSWFGIREGEFVSVHWESTPHIQRTLAMIRDLGGRPMLALNPATPIEVLDYVLDDIDGVLLMTVNPGFAGQPLVPATLEKIRDIRSFVEENGYPDLEIEVDGNVSFENAAKMSRAGAHIFVAGTSSIYAKTGSVRENAEKLRSVI